MRNSVPKSKRTRLRINVGMHSPQLSDMESRWCSVALAPCRVNWQKYALIRADEMSLSLASRRVATRLVICARGMRASLRNIKLWRSLMSKEFEKLRTLLHLSEPSERDPLVDRGEAAKLAARWERLVHRGRGRRIERSQMRQPPTSTSFS
jgi:hypothetical protein